MVFFYFTELCKQNNWRSNSGDRSRRPAPRYNHKEKSTRYSVSRDNTEDTKTISETHIAQLNWTTFSFVPALLARVSKVRPSLWCRCIFSLFIVFGQTKTWSPSDFIVHWNEKTRLRARHPRLQRSDECLCAQRVCINTMIYLSNNCTTEICKVCWTSLQRWKSVVWQWPCQHLTY